MIQPMTPEAQAAHATWKAACQESVDIRQRMPIPWMTDENRSRWCEIRDGIMRQWFLADDARKAAFDAMAASLPLAGKPIFISPRDWLAKEKLWRREFEPVRIWNGADFYRNWYPALATYEVDSSTGERFLRSIEMMDAAVDEAARRNASWAAYYAKQAA